MSGATGDDGIVGLPAEADASDVAARLRALDARLGRLAAGMQATLCPIGIAKRIN